MPARQVVHPQVMDDVGVNAVVNAHRCGSSRIKLVISVSYLTASSSSTCSRTPFRLSLEKFAGVAASAASKSAVERNPVHAVDSVVRDATTFPPIVVMYGDHGGLPSVLATTARQGMIMKRLFKRLRTGLGCTAAGDHARSRGLQPAAWQRTREATRRRPSSETSFSATSPPTNYAEVEDPEPRRYRRSRAGPRALPDGAVHIERQVTLDRDGNYVNHGGWKMYSHERRRGGRRPVPLRPARTGMWTRWHRQERFADCSTRCRSSNSRRRSCRK